MRSSRRRLAFLAVVLALNPAAFPAQKAPTPGQECEAPVYFGICDPYVPGTIIGKTADMKAIKVLSTWHDSPAEKASVCPGDLIVAVQGVPVAGHTFQEMLKQLVSPSPSPITLKVMRGNKDMEFTFQRARESTLAQLSGQKFMRMRSPLNGLQVRPVPLDETREGVDALDRFYARIDRRIGFKLVDGIEAPEGTPDGQIEKLRELRAGETEKVVGRTQLASGANSFSPGLTAVVSNDPHAVLVERVFPNSPAHRAGLFPGDELLGVNGHPVAGLTPQQLEDPREAIVEHVVFPSPVFDAGLHPGDLILEINGVPIEQITRDRLNTLLQPTAPTPMTLRVSRLGKPLEFRITPVTYREAEAKIGRKMTKHGPVPEHCPES